MNKYIITCGLVVIPMVLWIATSEAKNVRTPGYRSRMMSNIKREVIEISNCPHYDVNQGQNHPYEEGCVNKSIETIIRMMNQLEKM